MLDDLNKVQLSSHNLSVGKPPLAAADVPISLGENGHLDLSLVKVIQMDSESCKFEP
jgi:hypothetical protein